MSETKFTPGPWQWDDEVPTNYLTADWQNIAPWLVDSNGEPVLDGQIACGNAADTALIAAAPDLYEALRESTDLLHRIASGEDWGAIEEYIQDNEDVLAKARGES